MSGNMVAGAVMVLAILIFGVGLGLSEHYHHLENIAKIERGCDD